MCEPAKGNSALKIDTERFDEIFNHNLANDECCKTSLLEIKTIMGEEYLKVDAFINSLVIRISEIMHEQGIKDGINFIVHMDDQRLV